MELLNRLSADELKLIQKYCSEVPVKVGALAKELGLKISVSTLEPGFSGEIRPDEGTFLIRINKHEVKHRQRFTLAHEIAHYLFHRDLIGDGVRDNVLYRSSLTSQVEAEANRFAAFLLMPTEKLNLRLQELQDYDKDEKAEILAAEFGVSETAMRIRLGYPV
ncbi:ImmA/IrrE family metallo-endopeptidase [Curvivirga aplysinae]|uniref:ImmA/IrrE family metallo-endopeptidase n=1 Tax=Curvivirga aplysinae TaxID=2529852 RepID=UPI0012BD11A7|nr:ImmA/IrrE family metallo-endopeptidase [Curvivirga aplysinae]MTI09250.1 ImmA/IrrE family metallo-endopeptidase [Curvivirga aplysinae]